jgi:hypothetical protein
MGGILVLCPERWYNQWPTARGESWDRHTVELNAGSSHVCVLNALAASAILVRGGCCSLLIVVLYAQGNPAYRVLLQQAACDRACRLPVQVFPMTQRLDV